MGTLRGQVTGENQQGRYVPLSGAIVEIYSSGGALWTTALTDANGNYTLSGVPEQTSYDPRASYANYEEQWQRRVWVGVGATVTVNFALRALRGTQNAPPDTFITSGPAEGAVVSNSSVTFAWTGTDERPNTLQYSYRIDGGGWSLFSSATSRTFNNLANGSHTFEVKARDDLGLEDPTPARRRFFVSVSPVTNQPPETYITSGPSGTVQSSNVTFQWTGSDDRTPVSQLQYAYQMDSQGWSAWSALTAQSFVVGAGQHTFQVKARDAEGAEDPTPAQQYFTVLTNRPPETYIDPPSPAEGGTVPVSSVTFYWHGTDDRTPTSQLQYSYRLWLVGQAEPPAWLPWTTETSATFTDLVNGLHAFEVKAKDGDGLEDPTPAKRTFTVDDPIEVEFLWPKNGTRVGPWHLNDPRSAVDGVRPRDENDATRCSTRIIVKTRGDSSPQKAKLNYTFRHLEQGTTVSPNPNPKTGSSVPLRSDTQAKPPWAIYAVLFNFAEKAAGKWRITVEVETSTGIKKSKSIEVQVLTTTWPFVQGEPPNETEVKNGSGYTLHGFSYFRPDMLFKKGHRIPTQNENQGDGLDVTTDGNGRGRAPFSGKVVHVHEFKNKEHGYYIIIEGGAKTKTGTTVNLKAAIAHLTSIVKENDTVCVGQPLGNQRTDTFLHLELYNPDNQHPVLGDESKLPGGVNREEFIKLPEYDPKKPVKGTKKDPTYWQSATAYHQTLLNNIQAVLLNSRFGY